MENEISLETIRIQAGSVVKELLELHPLKKGQILVVGCSSSEAGGGKIGQSSSAEIGKVIFEAIKSVCDEKGIFLASQCCEHLNRALVVSGECAEKYGYDEVSVVPWLKGGGSFATASFYGTDNAVVVEKVRAHAGIDIGCTLIGMHLKEVAVPVRLSHNKIGDALVTAAFTRPKLIGGERAHYVKE